MLSFHVNPLTRLGSLGLLLLLPTQAQQATTNTAPKPVTAAPSGSPTLKSDDSPSLHPKPNTATGAPRPPSALPQGSARVRPPYRPRAHPTSIAPGPARGLPSNTAAPGAPPDLKRLNTPTAPPARPPLPRRFHPPMKLPMVSGYTNLKAQTPMPRGSANSSPPIKPPRALAPSGPTTRQVFRPPMRLPNFMSGRSAPASRHSEPEVNPGAASNPPATKTSQATQAKP